MKRAIDDPQINEITLTVIKEKMVMVVDRKNDELRFRFTSW